MCAELSLLFLCETNRIIPVIPSPRLFSTSSPFPSSSASKASSAGQTCTLPVLSTPAISGRWETRAASEEVDDDEEGGLGVGRRRVSLVGQEEEEKEEKDDGLGSGMVYVLMLPSSGWGGWGKEEEEAADDRMACRRIFHRAWALLRGCGGAVMTPRAWPWASACLCCVGVGSCVLV